MSYAKIDTDLGVVLHRQCNSTCLHTLYIELSGVYEVDLCGVGKIFTLHSPEEPRRTIT